MSNFPGQVARHDANHVGGVIVTDNSDATKSVAVKGDPVTGRMLVNSTGTVSISGTTLPISGATTAIGVAIVDASGNQVTTFGSSSDLAPATQNITVVDTGSTTVTGANNQTIIIGTPTAGSAASFALSSIETVRVEVTGIWTGTIATEASIDGGTTWTTQDLHQGAYTTGSFTAGFVGGANVAGATNFRVRATAAITGTVVVKVIESINTQSVYIANAAPSGNIISTLNSSTATLTSGSVFTGTSEDVSNFSEMRVSVFSDVASATDGLSIQQSSNNTNWDVVDTYTIPAGTGKTFVVPRQERYFRVVYTNGGTNQASFRLQSILNRVSSASSSQRTQDAYSNENDMEQTWAFNSFWNGTTWDRLRVAWPTVGNGQKTVTTAGTRVTLAASTTVKSVTIKALGTNTGIIYVGSSTVSSANGFQLYARDTVTLGVDNLTTVNIDSSVNGEGVSFAYIV